MEDSRRRRRRFKFKNDTTRSDADARNGDDDIYFFNIIYSDTNMNTQMTSLEDFLSAWHR
jgi:hypothetical protein